MEVVRSEKLSVLRKKYMEMSDLLLKYKIEILY